MKKIVIIPDSFKGTISSKEVCDIASSAIKKIYKDIKIISIPVADGGEGTVNAFLASVGGKKITLRVKNPFFEDINSFYGMLDDATAIIEMSSAAGLPLVESRKDPLKTTTYGVGQLILDALDKGAEKIILGLGGSSTNDFGVGAMAALGAVFLDQNKKSFIPTGGALSKVCDIDLTGMDNRIKNTEFITMCDVDNPLLGKAGATYTYASQKGATQKTLSVLEAEMSRFNKVVEDKLGIYSALIPGAGAAGGMGAGTVVFLNAKLQMGIEIILDIVKFDQIIKDADLVITGEGKIDAQSLRGKVIAGVSKRTKKANIPLVAFVGEIGDDILDIYDMGVSGIFTINRTAKDYEVVKHCSKENLRLTIDNLMRFIKNMKGSF